MMTIALAVARRIAKWEDLDFILPLVLGSDIILLLISLAMATDIIRHYISLAAG